MHADRHLFDSLVKRATGYQERAPVFRLERPAMDERIRSAITLAARIWPWFDECQARPDIVSSAGIASFLLPKDGRVHVFGASGAIAAAIHGVAARQPLAEDERRVDLEKLVGLAEPIARIIAGLHDTQDEELRFERLWRLKAQGTTLRGERTGVALLQATGAFRRYVHGLPVLGRASVHVTFGAGSAVMRWGVDWRRVSATALMETSVVEPDEAARRVLADLFWRRPENPFTLADFRPSSFVLGYLSMPRRQTQSVLQPAWVAILEPAGATTMGAVVAVPAAPEAFEPLVRPTLRARAREHRDVPSRS